MVLRVWRERGPNAADSILSDEIQAQPGGLLLQELHNRLHRQPGPRLLIDGCWFSRPYGGITRVWQQIFSTWQLPGLINAEAPVGLIDRKSQLRFTNYFQLEGQEVDPLILRQWRNCLMAQSFCGMEGQCVLFELDQQLWFSTPGLFWLL